MADISTGSQRGIVPFVDETTGRLPDQYLPQGVIDLQGDLEQAVTDAQRSATEAASSASNASQSASSASTSASQAGGSASQANGFASTASQAATTATGAASTASASASAAQQSATAASASASAAKASETNSASSASAAKASETNAADSATAARQAVDGFGLEVGTTTTGDPGTNAAVEIQKQGTRYTANFTIPRGDKGEPASVVHDATLTGDGTSGTPLGVAAGTAINPADVGWDAIDFNDYYANGIYAFHSTSTNGPRDEWTSGALMVLRSYQTIVQVYWASPFEGPAHMAVRVANVADAEAIPTAENWSPWKIVDSVNNAADASALTSRIAALEAESNELAVMQTRLQALEARIKSLETN